MFLPKQSSGLWRHYTFSSEILCHDSREVDGSREMDGTRAHDINYTYRKRPEDVVLLDRLDSGSDKEHHVHGLNPAYCSIGCGSTSGVSWHRSNLANSLNIVA